MVHKLIEFKGNMMDMFGFKNNVDYVSKIIDLTNYKLQENPFWSSEKVNITDIETINIECDIIQGSYINGVSTNILYTFPAFSVPLGYKIVKEQVVPIYFPLNVRVISRIRIRIIDQKERIVNFNGETINMSLHLRQV